MSKKVFIVGTSFASSFLRLFKDYADQGWVVVNTPEEADYLQFTGGADISPNFYKEPAHPTTSTAPNRDNFERAMYDAWLGKKKMLGVCRGAQLFCALQGGSLYQDVDNHTSQHKVVDVLTEKEVVVSSVHHQMMRPCERGQVLAIAQEATLREFMDRAGTIIKHGGVDHTGEADVEAVFYPQDGLLAFQPHPEFGPKTCSDYYFELIERVFG